MKRSCYLLLFALLCAALMDTPALAEETVSPADTPTISLTIEQVQTTPSLSPAPVPTASPAGQALRVEVIRPTPQPQTNGKKILIYHTHTWEAFAQVPEAPYKETEKWRTKDNSANMIAVGDALTAALTALGFQVEHDTTAFEPPDLSTSYTRSLRMLETRLERGEQYDLYIDLHRDAFASSKAIQKTVNIGGVEIARFMVLVGKGTTYDVKPDWEANYAYAERITESMNLQCEGLCRDVKVKTGRFNQHIAPCCVLIECGSNFNTLEEVLCGIPYLASAIQDAVLNAAPEEDGERSESSE